MPNILDFSPFIADRTRGFTGREWVFAKIDRWLGQAGGLRRYRLTGGPGKSMITARLEACRIYEQFQRKSEDDDHGSEMPISELCLRTAVRR